MEFKEFAKERKRMCDAICRSDGCGGCPIYAEIRNSLCLSWTFKNPERAEEIVSAWAKEHPRKTYLSQLLERYPGTPLRDDGTPGICPNDIGLKDLRDCTGEGKWCIFCWNQEVKDGECK